jgi:cytochrome c
VLRRVTQARAVDVVTANDNSKPIVADLVGCSDAREIEREVAIMWSKKLLASLMFPLILAGYAFADEPSGADIFKAKCTNCHSMMAGMSTLAPDLHDVVGRKVASLPSFKYSPALKAMDFVWTPEKLDEWLASPHKVAAETDMTFIGLKDAKERAAVIEFLRNFKAK